MDTKMGDYQEFVKGQPRLLPFDDSEEHGSSRRYKAILTAVENRKGVLDVDTVKGCTFGMHMYSNGGCYGECYAYKTAHQYGIDFSLSISRVLTHRAWVDAFCAIRDHHATWYRIGTAGDPSHDWEGTVSTCEALHGAGKTAVIITKHWVNPTDDHLQRLRAINAVINTSTSGLDSDFEIKHRVEQLERIRASGVRSVCRVVTCAFGRSEWARIGQEKQDYLLSLSPIIDNPLRADRLNARVMSGDILLTRVEESIGGGKFVSLHSKSAYLGTCGNCPDQCGANGPLSTTQKDDK